MLETANGKEPVMIGPILVHQKKNFDSYFKLSSSMLQECPTLKNLKVFGTDGDKNLSDAFEVCFTNAKHLLCDIHMQDNIERKLRELGITKSTAKEYLRDIFGFTDKNIQTKGLVDCMTNEEFNSRLETLLQIWKERHPNGSSFVKYFLEYKVDLIKNCMTADLRSLAGLGFPPKPYTQNANECMNAVIKGDIKKQNQSQGKLNEQEFVIALQKIVKRQETDVKLSLIGKGEYRLKDEYRHLQVPEDLFWRKSAPQREAVFNRMLKEPLRSRTLCDLDMTQKNQVDCCHLSVTATESQISTIPFQILENIFNDANFILNHGNGIVQVPGSTDGCSFYVLNRSQLKDPFKVNKSKTTESYSCETKCHRWNSYKLCSHTIAVAQHSGILPKYLAYYRSKKPNGNLSKMALTNMPRNRGKKPKGTSIRKGQNNKADQPITEYADQTLTEQPFHLTFLAGLIKKCYGCGQIFPPRLRAPPNDLILKRFGHRMYLSPRSKTFRQTPTLQNTYYHLNSDCCRRQHPMFEMTTDVIVHEEIKHQLTEGHKDILRKVKIVVQ